MTSPMMLVAVLTLLWLIVVVPMIVRRTDGRASWRPFRRGLRSRAAVLDAGALTSVEEAPMPAVDQADESPARRRMMARRRRSLVVLGVGSLATMVLAVLVGGLAWVAAGACVVALGGYLLFLRKQAMRDQERRAVRATRSAGRATRVVDAPPVSRPTTAGADSVVRIDDDDLALHTLDTVDLTGLYDVAYEVAGGRRAG